MSKSPQGKPSEDLIIRIRTAINLAGGPSAVAQKSGLSRRTINAYRAGETTPSSARIIALANGTGVSPEWLLTGKEPMLPEPDYVLGAKNRVRDSQGERGMRCAEHLQPVNQIDPGLLGRAIQVALREKSKHSLNELSNAIADAYALASRPGRSDSIEDLVRKLLS
ncbi:MAG: helix-turn-helix transcriptional regulator [Acidobacteria bacterium]|nr:helix-turn-helix transcriptional regulator [Acidobacteriota bacterium]MBI3488392.1 helix-turn-helix transcriptional regulator [Acidobacteriota bacterium]